MITKITELNKLKYEALFKKAWDELFYRGKFTEDELKAYYPVNTFTTLEDYFTKIKTLISPDIATYPDTIDKCVSTDTVNEVENPKAGQSIKTNYEFIMFPIDEPRFEIDANTREIAIPMNFRKLVGVQGDHVAETLIFAINRFVDYYDLLPTTINDMNIYIQWVNESGEDVLTEVSMIHYEADTQKILFGWPLTFNVTRQPRTIDFSVRFIVQDGSTVKYSLNTKTHQITIVKALQPTITSGMQKDNAANSFLEAITDSPSTDTPPAADPYFSAPGVDLPATYDYVSGGELKVQAIANDLGHIEYTKWTKNGSTISANEVYRVSTDTIRKGHKKYYVPVAGSPEVYEVYLEEEFEPGKTIYERFSVYSLPTEGSIVGTYKAYAKNKTSKNISNEIGSSECIIPGPSTISYTTNLDDSKVPTGASTGVALGVNVKQENAKDTIHYEWKYDSVNANMSGATTIEGANGSIYTISDVGATPGYYQVIATPVRNRENGTSIASIICRVTGKPAVPVINSISISPAAEDIDTDGDIDIDNLELTVLTAQMTAFGSQQSDSLIYKWYGKLADSGSLVEITPENANVYRADQGNGNIGFNTTKLYVYGGSTPITYKCVAKNFLNGQESEFGAIATAPGVVLE